LALNTEVDRDIPPCLYGDSMRIGQILLNYINNAIKFTRRGSVSLRVHLLHMDDKQCQLRFEVSDTGIGLSQEQITRLFQSFEQADASTTRQFGGTGLGLAICKQLAGLMGGQVGVDSKEGEGSTFWASLPLAIAPTFILAGDAMTGGVAATMPDKLRGLNILLAEDNLLNQQIAKELLEEYGVRVSIANNGREAIEQLQNRQFSCVLMDVRMPEMDGIEATQCIRANPQTADTLIIAMTANARTEDRDECLQAGMNDFISKPVDPAQFFRVLLNWLEPAENRPIPLAEQEDKIAIKSGQTQLEVDVAVISRMVKNNPEKIVRFTRTFIDSTRSGVEGIQQAMNDQSMEQLAQLAHRFKSSTRSMGAARLSDLLERLEKEAQASNSPALRATVSDIAATWQRIEAELAEYIRTIESVDA
jgi:CheY-like chemotaxis protein